MNKEAQEAYLERVQKPTELRPLTEKEAELLGRLINSEPVIRALILIHWQAMQIPQEIINLNFAKPEDAHLATRAQGQIQGVQNAIVALLQLTEVPSDEEDESGEPENE